MSAHPDAPATPHLARLDIHVVGASTTMLFAAAELARCLRIMSIVPARIEIHVGAQASTSGIALRMFRAGELIPALADARLDDALAVTVRDSTGEIVGANERSVLLGVYRLLHQLGCRWVRPGADGEYLPRIQLATITATLAERPSYRHRGICIEGAVSLEHVLALVDWMPKLGFSGYFMQFNDGYAFFDRWYSRKGTVSEPEPFSAATARSWTIRIEQEIAKRALVYHGVGHGWTCAALGMPLSHWDPVHFHDMAAVRHLLAEVKGERALQWDRPMITSLCFSLDEVRHRMIAVITEYAVAHPEVDLLHVWIDDGGKNKCECAACRVLLPSDLYVRLLHELDRELSARRCSMRIVFLGYSDLLWAPLHERQALDNQRFVFMYANSRETYDRALKALPREQATVPPFTLNASKTKRNMAEFQGFLQDWQAYFSGDSFIYEYHPLQSLTANQLALAYVVHEDVRQLRLLGLNGMVSCMTQRVFFPTGLSAYMLGRSLWNCEINPAVEIDDFYHASFGSHAALCKEFYKVSAEELGRTVSFEGRIEVASDAATHLAKLDMVIADFHKVVERNLGEPDPCFARSWHYARWHLRILERMTAIFAILAGVRRGDVRKAWSELKDFVVANEMRYQAVFDSWAFISQFDGYFVNGRFSNAPEAVVQE